MAPKPRVSRADQRRQTEERILDAARTMFAENGYDRTTIRGIAALAHVDAGLVMHYFGTKESLFVQCTGDDKPVPPPGASPDDLVEFLLDGFQDALAKDPVGQTALFRSMLTHPDAANAVRNGVSTYMAPIAEAIEAEQPNLRASVIGAIILGVAVGRILELDDLAQATPQELADVLRPSIRALVRDE